MKHLFKQILAHIPHAVSVKEIKTSTFIYANSQQAKLFNLPDKQYIIGKKDSDLYSSNHAQTNEIRDSEALKQTVGKHIHEYTIIQNRKLRFLKTTRSILKNANQEVAYILRITEDVTYLQNQEKTAQNADVNLRAVLESYENATVITNIFGRIMVYNNRAHRLLRTFYGKELIIDGNIEHFIPDVNMESFYLHFRQACQGKAVRFNSSYVRDSLVFNGEFHYIPLHDVLNNRVRRVIITFIDTTKRVSKQKRMDNLYEQLTIERQNLLRQKKEQRILEKGFIENRERLQLLADNSSELIALSEPDGTISYVSPSTERFTGYLRSDMYGKNLVDFFHVDDLEDLQIESQKQAVQSLKEIKLTHRFLTKHRGYIWVETIMKYIYDTDGNAISLQSSSRDVTPRIEAFRALASSESRYKSLFNSGNDGILLLKIQPEKLEFVEVNSVACQMLGYSEQELLQKTLFDITGKSQAHRIDRLLRIHENNTFESYITSASGTNIPTEMSTTAIKTHKNPVIQVVIRNIAERKQAELNKKAREIAERSLRFKTDFLANMSHEIRTPMNGILGMTRLLLNTKLNEKQNKYTETIYKSSTNLLAILNDILDLSKLEAGKLTLNPITFDIWNTLETIEGLFEALILQKRINLIFERDEKIPQYLVADQQRFIQIMTNLISNAIKFTDIGYVKISIKFIKDKEQNILKVNIEDTGKGIEKKDLHKLFEKFYQVQQDTYFKEKGTGLGLTICQELVKLWNGKIGAESEPQKGSRFWFTIPFNSVQENEIQSIHKKNKSQENKFQFDNPKILIADDNYVNQEVVRINLENVGCQVTIANNGKEALDLVRKSHFDLIFMDIQMPVMNGIIAMELIQKKYEKRDEKCPPIIGLSANVMEGNAKRYIKLGMNAYIGKPFEPADLFMKMSQYIPHKVLKITQNKPEIEKVHKNEKIAILNQKIIQQIKTLAKGNEQYINHLFESFYADSEALIETSKTAFDNQDFEQLQKSIHTLKGLSGTIGASKLFELSKVIHEQIKNNQHENITNSLEKLHNIYLQTAQEMKNIFSEK